MSSVEPHPGLQAPIGISVRPPHHSPGSPAATATEHLLALKGDLDNFRDFLHLNLTLSGAQRLSWAQEPPLLIP